FTCPFCDGYENRDRVWGLVISSLPSLEHMPHLYHHWTKTAKIILSPDLNLTDAHHQALAATGLSVHTGNITEIQHSAGKLEAITLDTGETVSVETLWWRLPEAPQPLTEQMISTFKLALNEHGYLKTDAFHQTSTKNLWAVGDVRGLANALTAAHQASEAAYAISRL